MSRSPPLQRPELVIFDCDGVLVDSEPLADRCFAAALRDIGLDVSLATLERAFRGRRLDSCLEQVETWLGQPLPDGFAQQLQAQTYAAFRKHLRPVPGVRSALAKVVRDAGLPVAVASSGEPGKIALSLGLTGLAEFFGDRVFSASSVARGKPCPDLFLRAATACEAAPGRCVVIEDSPAGIEAGLRAGMTVLAYAPGYNFALPSDAIRFTDMQMLPELLGVAG